MAWSVEFLESAKQQLKKIDRVWQDKILDYLEDEIATLDDPLTRGKVLVGDKARPVAISSRELSNNLRYSR